MIYELGAASWDAEASTATRDEDFIAAEISETDEIRQPD